MNELLSKNESNEVLNFDFEGHEVRMVVIDGEPWFVGKDIASALGYKDHTTTLRKIDNDDKMMGSNHSTPSFIDSIGRKQKPTLINESGLYTLIMGSQLQTENVKRFKRWVTKDILPSIRKN